MQRTKIRRTNRLHQNLIIKESLLESILDCARKVGQMKLLNKSKKNQLHLPIHRSLKHLASTYKKSKEG
jgi:hypothetical protein